VVREREVAATALHVERTGEVLEGDGGALDVPSGPSPAERAVPRRLAGSLELPDEAVQRVLLAGPLRVTAALGEQRQHLLRAQVRHRPEPLVGVHPEVQVAVDVVDRPGRYELLDVGHHGRDRLHRPHVVPRRKDAQRLHVLPEELGLAIAQRHPVVARLQRTGQQRVVDVGHVLDVVHRVTGVDPRTLQQVEGDVGGRVAHVGRVVRRDPADVEPCLVTGRGRPHLVGGGVVQAHGRAVAGQVRDGRGGPGAHGARS
jgi:hypothetical protein